MSKKILDEITQFHGHLGPYVVLGYRMGQLANKHLGNGFFSTNAEVFTGTTPPLSCIIDGIQMSSGCTLGKGNITVVDTKTPKACFTNNNGKTLELTLQKTIHHHIENNLKEKDLETYATQLYNLPDEALFEIH